MSQDTQLTSPLLRCISPGLERRESAAMLFPGSPPEPKWSPRRGRAYAFRRELDDVRAPSRALKATLETNP